MFLIIDTYLHHKNNNGLIKMLEYLKINYHFGKMSEIPNYKVIYSPSEPIDCSKYPDKKFIFGPHFHIHYNMTQLKIVQNIYNNAVCIQPSDWSRDVWKNVGASLYFPVISFPFPVDTEMFKPLENATLEKSSTNVFIYYKRRNPNELSFVIDFLNSKNISFKIFDYLKGYNEKDYIEYLHKCSYGIWLDAHESQGFALEEALSMNVPLLVWNITDMSQEYMSNYEKHPATTIPYWDERCGESFLHASDFEDAFQRFNENLSNYKPREYILENLSVEPCSKKLVELINTKY